MGRKTQKDDSLPGSLDMLKTLTRANLHGYAIVQTIQQRSGEAILIEEGSLYPARQRLELHGWIEGERGLTTNNRRRGSTVSHPRAARNWLTRRSATDNSRWLSRA